MDVLYYSNFCKHSQTLINTLSKSNIKNKFYYVCIDKRVQEGQNIIIVLENIQFIWKKGKTHPQYKIIN